MVVVAPVVEVVGSGVVGGTKQRSEALAAGGEENPSGHGVHTVIPTASA